MRSTTIFLVVAGIVLLSAVPYCAYAAEGGPWTYEVGIEQGFDDNRDGQASNKEAIFETRIRPRATLRTKWRTADIVAFYSPFLCFRDNPRSEQNRTDLYHDLSVDIAYRPTRRTRLSFVELFRYADDPAEMNDSRTFLENATYTMNKVSVKGSHEFLRRRAIGSLGIKHLYKRYREDIFASAGDETKVSIDAKLTYLTKGGFNVLADLGYADTSASTEYGRADRSSQVISGTLGLERTYQVWTVRARAGYARTAYDNAIADSKSIPVADLEIIYSPQGVNEISLDLQHRMVKGDISPYASQNRTCVALTAKREVSRRLVVALSGVFARGRYELDTVALNDLGVVVNPAKVDGVEDLTSVRLTARYVMTKDMTLTATYGFENWDADDQVRVSHQRNTFDVAVQARF
jgi:hypothetical protein